MEVNIGRPPPFDPTAEAAVIGAIFLDNTVMALVRDRLRPHHFYQPALGILYGAMVAVSDADSAIDAVTVAAELRRIGKLSEVGIMTIGNVTEAVATVSNFEHYLTIVLKLAAVRRTIYAAASVASEGYVPGVDADEYLAKSSETIIEAARLSDRPEDAERAGDGLVEIMNDLESQRLPPGLVPSGFDVYDRVQGGWWPGILHVVGGRPGMGKSALLLNSATNAALAGRPAVVFSLEDTKYFARLRLLARFADIDLQQLLMRAVPRAAWSRIIEAGNILHKIPLYIDDGAGLSSDALRQKVARYRAEHGVEIVFVDHLGFLDDAGDKEYDRVTHATKGLARMAKTLDLPVVCACQLNRGPEGRADHRPTMADLRSTGEIEQAARVVVFPFRPSYYEEGADDDDQRMTLIVGKANHGKVGDLQLNCRMSRMFIRGWDESQDGPRPGRSETESHGKKPGKGFTERERRRDAAGKDEW
jgi:replicative DNA helicase